MTSPLRRCHAALESALRRPGIMIWILRSGLGFRIHFPQLESNVKDRVGTIDRHSDIILAKELKMASNAAVVEQHIRASRQLMKRTLSSERRSKALLIRAGILTKDGKSLAKPYR